LSCRPISFCTAGTTALNFYLLSIQHSVPAWR